MERIIDQALSDAAAALGRLRADASTLGLMARAGELLAAAFERGARVYSCGNGGSLCDAMHFAEELSGRFRQDRPPLAALAIADAGHITCVANDVGYSQIFSRFIAAHGRAGDVLLAISTSGSSENVLAAARQARELEMAVVSLTGRSGSPLGEIATLDICTPAGQYSDRVQELHIKAIHILIECVEHRLFGR